ncbi:MAG: energy-coupling factor transporter transmembrane protein EcfT [Halobacterium sp.]
MTEVGLSYVPGDTVVHRLDPRTKLFGQFAVALLAFTWTDALALPVVWALVVGGMALARVRPRSVLRGYALPFALLAIATLSRAVTLGAPWVDADAAAAATLHSLRVAVVLLASAVFVQTTPVSETQAAISRLVPGKPGRFLAAGTSFVLRFLPVLLADLKSARAAQQARLGDQRRLHERMQTVALAGLNRTFERADRFSLALKARCFAWNPTEPRLSFSRADWLVSLGFVVLLAVAALT